MEEPQAAAGDKIAAEHRWDAGALARELAERRKAEALLSGQKHILEMVATGAPMKEALEALVLFIEAHALGMRGSILLLDEEGLHLRHGAAPSLPDVYTRAIDGVAIGPCVGSCGTAAFLKKPVFVEDIASDPLWAPYKHLALPHGLRSCWSTPIFSPQKRVLGTFAMYYGAPGRPTEEHLGLIDITTHLASLAIGRSRMETELRQSEERLRLAVQASGVGLWDWDLQKDQVFYSPEWKRQLGYLDHEIGASSLEWEHRLHPDDLERTKSMLTACIEGQSSVYDVEFRMRCKDGSYRWIYARGEVFREGSKPVRMMGCHVDITMRKQAEETLISLNAELERRVKIRTEELEQSVQELEAFSYSVSHDLRTPLRAIEGFSQILQEDHENQLDNEGLRCLQTVRHNTRRMSQLIDDLLSFSRTSRREVQVGTVDMAALAKEVFDELRGLSRGRNISMQIGELPPAQGDESMLRQVLVNLISNAIKFTGRRSVAEIEAGGSAQGEQNVYWVKDNGVGFNMTYADKLFGVFQRLHSNEEFEGTGIGLAIVKRIVERHGGQAWAEAKPGEGATVYFSLPKR